MKKTVIKNIILIVVLNSIAFGVSAEWRLNNTESTLNFISIKKSAVGEVHSFKDLEGVLKENGDVAVTVSMSSVETNIPIRNDRMKQMLFEVITFPKSAVSTKVDLKRINSMKVGESYRQSVELKLSIHGHTKVVDSEMRVTLLKGKKLLVSTIKPVIINVADYSLIKGVNTLKEVAKLPSISTAVPVTAQLIFEK
jgi:hypothetical protein